jgi:hypothetical protein
MDSRFRGKDDKGISMPFSQLSVRFFLNLLAACLLVFAVAVVLDRLLPLASELVIAKGPTDAVEFT